MIFHPAIKRLLASNPPSNAFQTVPDYVLKTSIVKWDGSQVDLVRADDPAGFALKVLSFGLLGVTVGERLSGGDGG